MCIRDRYLVVRGERKANNGRYLRRARFHGAFERRFWIGDSYDVDHVDAHIANGELTISGVIEGCQTWLRPSMIVIDARSRGCSGVTIAALSLIHISEPTRLLSISYAVF